MLRDHAGAEVLVQRHPGQVEGVATFHGDHRTRCFQCRQGAHRGALRSDGHDPLHAPPGEVLHGFGEGCLRGGPKRDGGRQVAAVPSRFLHSRHGTGGPVQSGVHRDDAQRVGPAGGQSPGRRVAAVPQLLDDLGHRGPGLGADVRVVAEHPRNGLMGDAGDARDVRHRGRSRDVWELGQLSSFPHRAAFPQGTEPAAARTHLGPTRRLSTRCRCWRSHYAALIAHCGEESSRAS